MIKADTCIRCEKAPPEWGSFLCKPCQAALADPKPSRPEVGIPIARRVNPYHNKPKGQWPQ